MSILGRCIAIAIAAFACAIAGIYVHTLFPSDINLSGDVIRSVSGLIGTLFAIVLGLLVSSSYTTFNSQQADFNSLVNAMANIDLLLKKFHGVSDKPRIMLRRMAVRLLRRYWPDESGKHGGEVNYDHLSEDVETVLEINKLSEEFENITRDDLNSIRQFSSNFIAIQSNIIRSLSSQVPTLLLDIVFGWACLLFFLYGSLSGGNIIAIFFLLLGAIAITSANFLILELTHPYQGIFKVSSAIFDLLLESMIQEKDSSR
ncbi:bestrophin-like domain [Cupriavidus sp. 8B]